MDIANVFISKTKVTHNSLFSLLTLHEQNYVKLLTLHMCAHDLMRLQIIMTHFLVHTKPMWCIIIVLEGHETISVEDIAV